MNHNREYRTSLIIISCYQILTVGIFAIDFLPYLESGAFSLGYFVLSMLIFSYSLFPMLILIFAFSRICNIDHCLTAVISKENLKDVMKIYQRFRENITLISRCFCTTLILRFFENLLHSVLYIFNAFDVLVNGHSQATGWFLSSGILFLLLEIFHASAIFVLSSLIRRTCKHFEVNYIQNFSNQSNFKHFLFCSDDISLSCGIFYVDWKFVFVFLGACFSYLIIIIQFVMI